MRKTAVLLFLIYVSCCAAFAQMRWNSAYQTYFDQYKDLAIEQMMRYNIPASITLAQGVFESGAGRSLFGAIGRGGIPKNAAGFWLGCGNTARAASGGFVSGDAPLF